MVLQLWCVFLNLSIKAPLKHFFYSCQTSNFCFMLPEVHDWTLSLEPCTRAPQLSKQKGKLCSFPCSCLSNLNFRLSSVFLLRASSTCVTLHVPCPSPPAHLWPPLPLPLPPWSFPLLQPILLFLLFLCLSLSQEVAGSFCNNVLRFVNGGWRRACSWCPPLVLCACCLVRHTVCSCHLTTYTPHRWRWPFVHPSVHLFISLFYGWDNVRPLDVSQSWVNTGRQPENKVVVSKKGASLTKCRSNWIMAHTQPPIDWSLLIQQKATSLCHLCIQIIYSSVVKTHTFGSLKYLHAAQKSSCVLSGEFTHGEMLTTTTTKENLWNQLL